jgi:hypothetical protein
LEGTGPFVTNNSLQDFCCVEETAGKIKIKHKELYDY